MSFVLACLFFRLMGRKSKERFWITFTATQTSDSIWQFFLIIGNKNLQIDPSMNGMVFSTFDWDQLGKILQHSWKKYLKISSKVVNFESDLLKTNEEIALQRREIYIHCMVVAVAVGRGQQVHTHHHSPVLWPLCRKWKGLFCAKFFWIKLVWNYSFFWARNEQ